MSNQIVPWRVPQYLKDVEPDSAGDGAEVVGSLVQHRLQSGKGRVVERHGERRRQVAAVNGRDDDAEQPPRRHEHPRTSGGRVPHATWWVPGEEGEKKGIANWLLGCWSE